MAASADQNPPVVVDLSVTAMNDSRVSDQKALQKTAADYLRKAGYRVDRVTYPSLGAATSGLDQLVDFPFLGKIIVSILNTILRTSRRRRRQLLESSYPSVMFLFAVKPDCGRYDAPVSNPFGGIVALLPGLADHLQQTHPHRRYSFEIHAPASPEHRHQKAFLNARDLSDSRLLRLIREASKPSAKDCTQFRFSNFFPHTLIASPPNDGETAMAKPMGYTSAAYSD